MKKILIINNDPDTMCLLKDLLYRAGFETKAKSNIAAAITEINEFKPDLLLLDIDQQEIIDRLGNEAEKTHIPVVLMTGHQHTKKVTGKKISGIIQKPFTIDNLVKKIDSVLA